VELNIFYFCFVRKMFAMKLPSADFKKISVKWVIEIYVQLESEQMLQITMIKLILSFWNWAKRLLKTGFYNHPPIHPSVYPSFPPPIHPSTHSPPFQLDGQPTIFYIKIFWHKFKTGLNFLIIKKLFEFLIKKNYFSLLYLHLYCFILPYGMLILGPFNL
jgi:hypothetical protein